MKPTVTAIALLLFFASPCLAEVNATNPQLLAAREHAHRAAERLDQMTEKQWAALQISRHRDPDRTTLDKARQEAHDEADKLDNISDQDWVAMQMEVGKSLQGFAQMRDLIISRNGQIGSSDIMAITGKPIAVPSADRAAPGE